MFVIVAAIENDDASKNISAIVLLATSSVNLFAQPRSDNMEQLKALLKMCQILFLLRVCRIYIRYF